MTKPERRSFFLFVLHAKPWKSSHFVPNYHSMRTLFIAEAEVENHFTELASIALQNIIIKFSASPALAGRRSKYSPPYSSQLSENWLKSLIILFPAASERLHYLQLKTIYISRNSISEMKILWSSISYLHFGLTVKERKIFKFSTRGDFYIHYLIITIRGWSTFDERCKVFQWRHEEI